MITEVDATLNPRRSQFWQCSSLGHNSSNHHLCSAGTDGHCGRGFPGNVASHAHSHCSAGIAVLSLCPWVILPAWHQQLHTICPPAPALRRRSPLAQRPRRVHHTRQWLPRGSGVGVQVRTQSCGAALYRLTTSSSASHKPFYDGSIQPRNQQVQSGGKEEAKREEEVPGDSQAQAGRSPQQAQQEAPEEGGQEGPPAGAYRQGGAGSGGSRCGRCPPLRRRRHGGHDRGGEEGAGQGRQEATEGQQDGGIGRGSVAVVQQLSGRQLGLVEGQCLEQVASGTDSRAGSGGGRSCSLTDASTILMHCMSSRVGTPAGPTCLGRRKGLLLVDAQPRRCCLGQRCPVPLRGPKGGFARLRESARLTAGLVPGIRTQAAQQQQRSSSSSAAAAAACAWSACTYTRDYYQSPQLPQAGRGRSTGLQGRMSQEGAQHLLLASRLAAAGCKTPLVLSSPVERPHVIIPHFFAVDQFAEIWAQRVISPAPRLHAACCRHFKASFGCTAFVHQWGVMPLTPWLYGCSIRGVPVHTC